MPTIDGEDNLVAGTAQILIGVGHDFGSNYLTLLVDKQIDCFNDIDRLSLNMAKLPRQLQTLS